MNIIPPTILVCFICLVPMAAEAQNFIMNPTIPVSVGRNPESLTRGDFNRDGSDDLAIVNSGSDDITILLGNGNGTFQAGYSIGVGESPMCVVTGDMNGDHKLDLVVAASGSDTVFLLLGKGNGWFHPPKAYSAGKGPTFLSLMDMDGDGDLDVFVVNSGRFGHYTPFSLSLNWNNGEGNLQRVTHFDDWGEDGMFPTGVYPHDFNHDGFSDVAVTWSQPSWRTPNGLVTIMEGSTTGTFSLAQKISPGFTLSSINGADLDNDQDIDLIVTSMFSDELLVLRQGEQGQFQKAGRYKVGFSPLASAIEDLNRDGLMDIVVTNRASNSVSLLMGAGSMSFTSSSHFAVGLTPTSQILQDVDQDGAPDIMVANSGSNSVSVLLTGSAGVPSVVLSTDSLNFGILGQGASQETKTLSLSNVGLGPLIISKVIVNGDQGSLFEVSNQECIGQTLATGKVCHVSITFQSGTPGAHFAEMKIWDNAPGGPRIVTLSGTVEG